MSVFSFPVSMARRRRRTIECLLFLFAVPTLASLPLDFHANRRQAAESYYSGFMAGGKAACDVQARVARRKKGESHRSPCEKGKEKVGSEEDKNRVSPFSCSPGNFGKRNVQRTELLENGEPFAAPSPERQQRCAPRWIHRLP